MSEVKMLTDSLNTSHAKINSDFVKMSYTKADFKMSNTKIKSDLMKMSLVKLLIKSKQM